jgi:FimV-like protein
LEPENYLYDAPVRGAVTESVAEVKFPTATNTLTTNHLPPITQGPLSSAVLNTKFELALACREIGDHAGARELLAEVAHARDPELAQRAQTLLQQLA